MPKHKKEKAQPQLPHPKSPTHPRSSPCPCLCLQCITYHKELYEYDAVQLQWHATLSALLEERDPELCDAVQLQCHATLSALLQEHDPDRMQISKLWTKYCYRNNPRDVCYSTKAFLDMWPIVLHDYANGMVWKKKKAQPHLLPHPHHTPLPPPSCPCPGPCPGVWARPIPHRIFLLSSSRPVSKSNVFKALWHKH